jgi:hypothetical protein
MVVGAARFAAGCLAAGLFAACGLGVNGLEATVGDGGVSNLDAAADTSQAETSSSSGADTGSPPPFEAGTDTSSADTGTAGDVVVEAAPTDGCVPTGPENCTNGIDDDCNGLTDCADPACTTQGYACVAAPSAAGWDFVPFDLMAQPGCPSTLKAHDVNVDPQNLSSPAVCSCTCSVGTPPTCETGNITSSYGTAMNACTTPGMAIAANGGACNAQSLTVEPFVMSAQPAPSGGTCASASNTTVPPTEAGNGEYCTGETTFGAGCASGQVCALVPTGFTACIHHGGANMGCTTPGYVLQVAVGTVMDDRACSGNCICGATPTATCTPGSWDFYATNDCSGAVGAVITTNNACAAPSATGSFMSNRFTSTATAGTVTCGAPTATPMPSGNATLAGADTLCCE